MRRHARGLTLVELMVALVLSLLVVLAAAAVLLTARRGFSTVDAAGQLDDNARFAIDLIQRIAAQSGHLDDAHAMQTRAATVALAAAAAPPNFVQGYDDALAPAGAIGVDGSRSAGCPASAGTACRNGSDVLVLRTQADALPDGSGTDGATLDCMGDAVKLAPTARTDLSVSVLFVDVGVDDEPSLMCRVGTTAGMTGTPQPVVQGVESFQVLYGGDGAAPGVAPAGPADGVAERFLRADQMAVPGDAAATRANWQRVRSLRIGMVLRSRAGVAQEGGVAAALHPLGEALATAGDVGSRFVPPADGRLRQAVAFTVHLHNRQTF